MKYYIKYVFIRCLIFLLSLIPFRLLYLISDCCSFAMQYGLRYRSVTVLNNIINAFPEKSIEEIKIITRKFYKYLCDTILESLKGYSLGGKQLLKRYQFLNPDGANKYYEEGQDIIIALSHYCNWEWGTQIAESVYKHKLIFFYKPISNKYFERYILKLRTKRNTVLLSIHDPEYILCPEENKPKAYFIINDQGPKSTKKAIWITSLNQNMDCIRDIEEYAKIFNLPVIYPEVQRVKRGYYTVEMHEICSNPSDTLSGEITERYMRKLETIIVKKPEDWLWSHQRWGLKSNNF